MVAGVDQLTIRPATLADRPAILGLLSSSLGWEDDERHAELFAWKHDRNPFGASFAWVAEDPDAGVVGFRTFMRWRFETPDGSVEAVRAVDTATAPTHRGAGIFRRLTLHGLDEVRAAGVRFVFNTPNDQSRPGYLKMGWQEVGRLPVVVRPRSLAALPKVLRARVPAELWSEQCDAGMSVEEALGELADESVLGATGQALATARSVAFLRWRYSGLSTLQYRAVPFTAGRSNGAVIVRLRRRGPALECVVADVLPSVWAVRPRRSDPLVVALRATSADHAIAVASAGGRRAAGVRVSTAGPVLTWRSLVAGSGAPSLDSWRLNLGDVELF